MVQNKFCRVTRLQRFAWFRRKQELLAEMIGTTRSRVSFFMNKFRKLGFIEYNGKLEVHNSLLNVVLHDKPEIKTRDEAISAE